MLHNPFSFPQNAIHFIFAIQIVPTFFINHVLKFKHIFHPGRIQVNSVNNQIYIRLKKKTCILILTKKYITAQNTQVKILCPTKNGLGPGSVVGIATGYGLDGLGIKSQWGRDFPHLSIPAWGPPSLLYNGYQVFPGGKERPGRDTDPSPPSSAVVMKG